MTDQFDKTEKQYIELTSGIQRFEHFSVYTDPFLPQIFSHNFVQLHRTFPLDKLLPFFSSVPGLLQANYIHVKAAPEHAFPLLLKQNLVKQGCVVEDELFFARKLENGDLQAGHPLTAWGTEKSLANVKGIIDVHNRRPVGEAFFRPPSSERVSGLQVPIFQFPCKKQAPTIAIKYDKLSNIDQFKEFAKMTGTEDKADKWLAEWDKKTAAAKTKVQKAVGSKTISIMQTNGKDIYVFGKDFGRGGSIIYDKLGLKATKLTQEKAINQGPGYASISLEKLPDFAGDYIFMGPWQAGGDDKGVLDSSIWKNLDAVKQNHVYRIDPIGFYFSDPISLEGQLDYITKSLTK